MRYIWKRCFAALLAVVMVFVLLPGLARAADDFPDSLNGKGNAGEPYQIENAEQLKQLSEYVNGGHNCQNTYFELTENIDLGGEEWTPIGSYSTPFAGSFDGQRHIVTGLFIPESNSQWQGLFGCVSQNGKISNLGVEGSITNKGGQSGGIVGTNDGTIENCHFAGSVAGRGEQQYGGIAGHNNGTIRNCYNTGTISGNGNYFAGIVGGNRGLVEDCYNIGAVDGARAGGIVGSCSPPYGGPSPIIQNCYNTGIISGGSSGGITGVANEATIKTCYYLENTASKSAGTDYSSNMADVDSKSEEEFRSLADTLGADWTNDTLLGRPVLTSNQEPVIATAEHPFEITDKAALENLRNYVNSGHDCSGMYFQLADDIKLGGDATPWMPIGDINNQFKGTFDGDSHTVSGLYINQPDKSGLSLFGAIGMNGTVKNLSVSGSVAGGTTVGGIAGINSGSTSCLVSPLPKDFVRSTISKKFFSCSDICKTIPFLSVKQRKAFFLVRLGMYSCDGV